MTEIQGDSVDINPNLLFTAIFAKQLASLGVTDIVLCAGSRSTPLTSVFGVSDHFRCYSQVDERSGSFFALGLAKATNKPVAVVSTSGTAGANFYPAVIEAKASGVPLLILTADRPQELRISGANQTTDQIKLYGDHVNWFADVLPPMSEYNHMLLRYMQHLALQAVQHSLFPFKGPVHLNFPFRKPLQPTVSQLADLDLEEIITQSGFSFTPLSYAVGTLTPSISMIDDLIALLKESTLTMIIAGPNASQSLLLDTLQAVQEKSNAIFLPDPLSGFRYTDIVMDHVIYSYETMLKFAHTHLPPPDLILHVGDMPISKYLGDWLSSLDYSASTWVTINESAHVTDGELNSRISLKVNPEVLFNHLIDKLPKQDANAVKHESWVEMNRILRQRIEESCKKYFEFEPELLHSLFTELPPSNIFVSNSLVPRHLDQFVFGSSNELNVYSSRGVSGIDGTLSTALGIAEGNPSKPTYLITGDLAFYHDLNGLLAMMRYKIPLNIFVINNGGGAIFDRLPIRSYNPPFEEFFLTQHELNFDRIAGQYGINYLSIDLRTPTSEDEQKFRKLLKEFVDGPNTIFEILVEVKRIEEIRIEIMNYIQKIFK